MKLSLRPGRTPFEIDRRSMQVSLLHATPLHDRVSSSPSCMVRVPRKARPIENPRRSQSCCCHVKPSHACKENCSQPKYVIAHHPVSRNTKSWAERSQSGTNNFLLANAAERERSLKNKFHFDVRHLLARSRWNWSGFRCLVRTLQLLNL